MLPMHHSPYIHIYLYTYIYTHTHTHTHTRTHTHTCMHACCRCSTLVGARDTVINAIIQDNISVMQYAAHAPYTHTHTHTHKSRRFSRQPDCASARGFACPCGRECELQALSTTLRRTSSPAPESDHMAHALCQVYACVCVCERACVCASRHVCMHASMHVC